jgi:peptide/nickel transport system permease protein
MGVRSYIVKRVIVAIFILWVIASLNFVIFQVISPIRPEMTILDPHFTPAVRAALRSLYGLDEPLYVRYLLYLRNMFTWRFGRSFDTMRPVVTDLMWRLPNTVVLLGLALILTVLVGIPVGILAASRRGTKVDAAAIGAGLFTWGVPTFFVQLLFILFFCAYLGDFLGVMVIPSRGMYSTPPPEDILPYIADVAWHLFLPILSLVVAGFGSWALYTRNIMLDALTQDYIVTARAKGLAERTVLYRHAFRSILPPIVTMVAMAIPGIVTGAMITEYLFSLPGIGQWYLTALTQSNYPVVQAVLFIYAVLMIIANLVADLLYGVLDPRIRVGQRR